MMLSIALAVGLRRPLGVPEGGGDDTGGSATEQFTEIITAPRVEGWDLVLALLVILGGWISSRYASRATERVLRSVRGVSEDLCRLSARVVRIFLVILGLGIALVVLGAEIRPVLTAGLLVSVAAALALRGVADNFSAGIVLQARQPIHLGDIVEILGHEGVVRDINSRAVVLETFDGRAVHLPNKTVLDEPLSNHTALGSRRSEMEARWRSPSLDADITSLRGAVAEVPGVLHQPPPAVLLTAHDSDRVTVRIHVWHRPDGGAAVRSDVVRAVSDTLAEIDPARSVISPPPPPPLTPVPER